MVAYLLGLAAVAVARVVEGFEQRSMGRPAPRTGWSPTTGPHPDGAAGGSRGGRSVIRGAGNRRDTGRCCWVRRAGTAHKPMAAADDVVAQHPFVVAHRGASVDRPEHTLGAYELALRDGADGVECDVRLTSDGHLVCVHDRRVDRTSSGAGWSAR